MRTPSEILTYLGEHPFIVGIVFAFLIGRSIFKGMSKSSYSSSSSEESYDSFMSRETKLDDFRTPTKKKTTIKVLGVNITEEDLTKPKIKSFNEVLRDNLKKMPHLEPVENVISDKDFKEIVTPKDKKEPDDEPDIFKSVL